MTMPPDIMYAILAMAAYDEGTQPGEQVGIAGVGNTLGDASVLNVNGKTGKTVENGDRPF
jgi:hypothetical protein